MPVLYWLPTSLPCLFNEVGSIIVQNLANNSLSDIMFSLLGYMAQTEREKNQARA